MEHVMKHDINHGYNAPQRDIVIREGEALNLPQPKQHVLETNIAGPEDYWKAHRHQFSFTAEDYEGYRKGTVSIHKENLVGEAPKLIEGLSPYPNTVVVMDSEKQTITLATDLSDPLQTVVIGTLVINPELETLGINGEKTYSVEELHKLLKKIRFHFNDRAEHTEVLEALQDYKAQVRRSYENKNDLKGNARVMFEQQLEPARAISFQLNMPLFKGAAKTGFVVEVLPEPQNTEVKLALISDELHELFYEGKEQLLEDHLEFFIQTGVLVLRK